MYNFKSRPGSVDKKWKDLSHRKTPAKDGKQKSYGCEYDFFQNIV
jgi:hypothetical protein